MNNTNKEEYNNKSIEEIIKLKEQLYILKKEIKIKDNIYNQLIERINKEI